MRFHLLFPLAFLSGIYGFFFFAPYLLVIVAARYLIRSRRRTARRLAPVAAPIKESFAMAGLAAAV
jgi:hypothetical protein